MENEQYHYSVLGIKYSADQTQIIKAYVDKTKKLIDVSEVLSDPIRRDEYDASITTPDGTDHYVFLDVPQHVTPADLIKAILNKSKKLIEALEVLSNPEKRIEFDASVIASFGSDYYNMLGVQRGVIRSDLISAYVRLLRAISAKPASIEKDRHLQAAVHAYKVLSNAASRLLYDNRL